MKKEQNSSSNLNFQIDKVKKLIDDKEYDANEKINGVIKLISQSDKAQAANAEEIISKINANRKKISA